MVILQLQAVIHTHIVMQELGQEQALDDLVITVQKGMLHIAQPLTLITIL